LVFWVWDGRHAGAPRVNGTSIPRTRLFSHYENKICDVKITYTAPVRVRRGRRTASHRSLRSHSWPRAGHGI